LIDWNISSTFTDKRGDIAMNEIAIEFTRYVLEQNPHADDFAGIYDAMSRAACTRAFNNLGHAELAQAGVSFSLLNTNDLERLISEAKKPTRPQ
jgi:hypothetical protein